MYLSFHPPIIFHLISTPPLWFQHLLSISLSSALFLSAPPPPPSIHRPEDLDNVREVTIIWMSREFTKFAAGSLEPKTKLVQHSHKGLKLRNWVIRLPLTGLPFVRIRYVYGTCWCVPGTCRTRWIPGIWHHRTAHQAISLEQPLRLQGDPSSHNLCSKNTREQCLVHGST